MCVYVCVFDETQFYKVYNGSLVYYSIGKLLIARRIYFCPPTQYHDQLSQVTATAIHCKCTLSCIH